MKSNVNLYKTMLLIRRFEERVLHEFSTGNLIGTTHTYIGQEADAAGIFSEVDEEDIIFSNHRCHGHFLAYGGKPYDLIAELMGKSTGLVGGRGGSQHIHYRNFYSNGVQGGIVPIGAGMALAEKIYQSKKIVVVFIGDGTLGEGVLYESVNMSSLWNIPLLIVVENNRYAQTTPVEAGVAGSLAERFQAFGIPVWEVNTSDVLTIKKTAREAIFHVRSSIQSACLLIHTYRFCAHSKGDDIRSQKELEQMKGFDPISIHAGRISKTDREQVEREVIGILDDAFMKALQDPAPGLYGVVRQ